MAFERDAVADGDERTAGRLRIPVARHARAHRHPPGLCRLDTTATGGPPAVFTGGSLLFGSVGRTDLVDPERTEELTRAQYRSARRLAELLPDDAAVYPTHGFGSFCSSGSADRRGRQHHRPRSGARNDALLEPDEDAFVDTLIAGLTAYPRYYAHMGARNRQGPRPRPVTRPSPSTRPSCATASRPASGSSTCATAPPTPPNTSAAPSGSRSATSSPPTWAGSSRGTPR